MVRENVMTHAKFFLYLGATIAICVSVAWALVRVEAGVRTSLVDGIENRIILMHDDLKSDIRELRGIVMRENE